MLVFDLETSALPSALKCLGPVKPDSRLKDGLKIALDLQDKLQKRTERAALDLDTAQIVAIGLVDESGVPTVLHAGEMDEAQMLNAFWIGLQRYWVERPTGTVVTFNGHGFDWPVLLRRSMLLNVVHPSIELSKYRSDPRLVDLVLKLTWGGLVEPKGLGVYCKLFGLDVPEDATTGADIGELVENGDWQAVAHHVETDILKTLALAQRIGVK